MSHDATTFDAHTITTLFAQFPPLSTIIQHIIKLGGRPLLVGGAVRDLLLGRVVKDIDIELYGITLETLQALLATYGPVRLKGTSFGVLSIDGLAVDWSVPRADLAANNGTGRKPTVVMDVAMDYVTALRRRDLTMNAMGIDLIDYTIVDPYHGRADIHNKTLRAVDPQFFVQDPLRLFRVMQFIGRFAMTPDAQLNEICRSMDVTSVSKERIELEMDKLMLQSCRPSLGLRWLHDIGRLADIFPALDALHKVPQRPDFHPEGNVFEHSMQAVDAAAAIVAIYDSVHDAEPSALHDTKLIVLYAALTHDMGKTTTTIFKDGMWRSPGHAAAGVPTARSFLQQFMGSKDRIERITKLVYHHMAPGELVRGNARLSRYKILAARLGSLLSLKLLADVATADRRGRNGQGSEPLTYQDEEIAAFVDNARAAGVLYSPEPPLLKGADLMAMIKPGPRLGMVLDRAYEMQLEENITDRQRLLDKVLKKYG